MYFKIEFKDTMNIYSAKTIYIDICIFVNKKILFATNMKHIADLSWKQNLAFATEVDGHPIIVDASTENGGDDLGPRPKKLMLIALAGCTGVDVISILRKMKIVPEAFHVIVEGDLAEEHPKKYEKMKVIYQFKGKNLPYDKLEKAIQLSEEKYCSVSAVYRQAIEMSHEIRIEDGE
jgi:putative redox protein